MSTPIVLTKFTKYHESLFLLDNAGIKISLPSEFNDIFDSQISIDKDYIKKVSAKNDRLISMNWLEFHLEAVGDQCHVLSFISNSSIDIHTSHMWAIYADNGNGIALEFDYEEIDNRANNTLVKRFVKQLSIYDSENNSMDNIMSKKIQYVKTPEGQKAFKYMLEGINANEWTQSQNLQNHFNNLFNNVDTNFLQGMKPQFESILQNVDSHHLLYKVNYTDDFRHIKSMVDLYILKEILYKKKQNCDERETKLINKQINLIEQQFVNFYSTKSNIWQNENEYRIIVPYYSYNYFIKKCIDSIDLLYCQHQRAELRKTLYYCYYDDKCIKHSVDNVDGLGAVPLINLPYPKKIFLGWDFKDQSQINSIKEFCKKFKVKLFQIERCLNHNTVNEFVYNEIVIY